MGGGGETYVAVVPSIHRCFGGDDRRAFVGNGLCVDQLLELFCSRMVQMRVSEGREREEGESLNQILKVLLLILL